MQALAGAALRKGIFTHYSFEDRYSFDGKKQAATLKLLTDRGASMMEKLPAVCLSTWADNFFPEPCVNYPICDEHALISEAAVDFIIERMTAECKANNEKLQEVIANGTSCTWRTQVLDEIIPGKYKANPYPSRRKHCGDGMLD